MDNIDTCPNCGTQGAEGSDDFYQGDEYKLRYDCLVCGRSWYAIYKFEGKVLLTD